MKNFVIGSLLLVLLFSCKTEKKSNKNLDLFTEEFLESKNLNELQIMRNDFFARKGYVFKNKEIQKYFESKKWYTPKPNNTIKLTDIEKQNIELIQKVERNKKLKLTHENKIIKVSSVNILSKDELKSKTNRELQLLRNEFFARQGYVFENEKIQKYFEDKKWYKPNSKAKITLTKEEQNYIKLIKELEKNKAD